MRQKIATIFGASGFIGRHLIRRLTQKNYRIIAVTRSPYLHGYLKLLGNIGQIDLEKVNIFDEEKIRPIIESSDIVINLVGILFENKIQKFENIHAQFPYLIAKLCKEYNVEKLVHLSALGANINSNSNYMKSKARGEKYILDNIKNSVILRPSVIFGPEDNFFNQFASLTQFLPFLPLIGGGKNKFQPIYVLDVVKSIITVLEKEKSSNKIYELCGPEIFTFKELMEILLKQIKKKRLLLPVPYKLAKYNAKFFQLFPKPLLTEDQVLMLEKDNIETGKYETIKSLNIKPSKVETILPNYIYRFRKHGQFA